MNFVEKMHSNVYIFKESVEKQIRKIMDNTCASIAISMMFGDVAKIDETLNEEIQNIGVSHLMSISGTHIALFMVIINFVLRLFKNDKKTKQLLRIICVCIYIVCTGLGISVLRAGIMIIISILYDTFSKRKNKYISILVAFFMILLHKPFAIFNTGMLLSFLSTLGIILFNEYFITLFGKITFSIKSKIIMQIITYVIKNISIIISVQLLIIPIQIQFFNKIPFPIIIPNLVLGIIASPIILLGIVGSMFIFMPSLSSCIFSIIELLIKFFIYIVKILNDISLVVSVASQPMIFIVLYYFLVLVIWTCFTFNNLKGNKGKYNFTKLIKIFKIFKVVLITLVIILVVVINMYSIYYSKYIYFFNVEQGEMSYVKYKDKSVIVDIGSMKEHTAFNAINSYFKMSNLKKVDAIIISHFHKDHINGIEEFVKKYKVGMAIYSVPKNKTQEFIDFENILSKYNVNKKIVLAPEQIDIGEIQIQFLLPDKDYIHSFDDINTNSLVCKLTVKDRSVLYMGDATVETEKKLIKECKNLNDIYILKVGHHGSKTSTSEEFVRHIKPKNAVISALKRYYGHPHENTLQTLEDNNVYIYLTELMGAVKFNL